MKIEKELTKEFKKEFLETHFYYEVTMFLNTFFKMYRYQLKADAKDFSNELLRVVFLETFMLHTRNLIEFFYYKNRNEQSSVTDFIEILKWRKLKSKKFKGLDVLYSRICSDISHLTYDRKPIDTTKSWDTDIFSHVFILIEIFLNEILLEIESDKLKVLLYNIGEYKKGVIIS